MCSGNKYLFVFFLFLVCSMPGTSLVAGTADDVAQLAAEGKTDAIRAGLEGGLWAGTIAEDLASGLFERDGLAALAQFEKLTDDPESGLYAQTLAWHHVYGYAELTGNRSRMRDAVAGMKRFPAFGEKLYGGKLPELPPEETWAVQIGAFGSRSNAERLASQQSRKGYTVDVVPLKSGGRTLYAVWVGQFGAQSEASAFGSKTYGKEGRDFRTVKRGE